MKKIYRENRTILITKNFSIYIPEIYGIDTWGDGYHQESMEQNKDGEWIIHNWWYGGEFEDDTVSDYKVDVLATFNKVKDAKAFLQKNHKGHKILELDVLLEMYEQFTKSLEEMPKNEKKSMEKGK